MKRTRYKIGDNAERCSITNRLWHNDEIAITHEGPIATVLWGDVPIEFDNYGLAIIPPHLIELFKVVCGYEPDNG